MMIESVEPDQTRVAARDPRIPVAVFGIGIGLFVLYLITIAIGISSENDFAREAWGPYRLLSHGHVLGFIRTGPAYVGSLILRAPFALIASIFGAGYRTTYVLTALPCVIAPGLLAAWLSAERRASWRPGDVRHRRVWPLDLFMLVPSAVLCLYGGHPEDILGATLCVASVVLAQRESGGAAGVLLGIALINKSWAIVVVPVVLAVLPADQRLRGLAVTVVTAGAVLVPVEIIRTTSSNGSTVGLGGGTGNLFLPLQLWWFFGRHSWVAREGHFLLVAIGWTVTGVWWWLQVHRRAEHPRLGSSLLILALVFFLRAALDPWDNTYYFTPFLLTVVAYEDRREGFPWLSWAYAVMVVVVVPLSGVLGGLGYNGHAAVFGLWALATIAYFGWRSFSPSGSGTLRTYAAASRAAT